MTQVVENAFGESPAALPRFNVKRVRFLPEGGIGVTAPAAGLFTSQLFVEKLREYGFSLRVLAEDEAIPETYTDFQAKLVPLEAVGESAELSADQLRLLGGAMMNGAFNEDWNDPEADPRSSGVLVMDNRAHLPTSVYDQEPRTAILASSLEQARLGRHFPAHNLLEG